MDYNSILDTIKKQNPTMPYREQQKKASDMLKSFSKAQETLSSVPSGKREPVEQNILAEAEKRIRANVIDVNSIISIGKQVMPAGELVRHSKEGVNTLVTFEDGKGNKLPLIGHFRIYI